MPRQEHIDLYELSLNARTLALYYAGVTNTIEETFDLPSDMQWAYTIENRGGNNVIVTRATGIDQRGNFRIESTNYGGISVKVAQ